MSWLDHLAHRKALIQSGAARHEAIVGAHLRELVLAFQVHPQLRTRAQRVAELDGRFGRDGALAGDDLVDQARRPADDPGPFGLRPDARRKFRLEAPEIGSGSGRARGWEYV